MTCYKYFNKSYKKFEGRGPSEKIRFSSTRLKYQDNKKMGFINILSYGA